MTDTNWLLASLVPGDNIGLDATFIRALISYTPESSPDALRNAEDLEILELEDKFIAKTGKGYDVISSEHVEAARSRRKEQNLAADLLERIRQQGGTVNWADLVDEYIPHSSIPKVIGFTDSENCVRTSPKQEEVRVIAYQPHGNLSAAPQSATYTAQQLERMGHVSGKRDIALSRRSVALPDIPVLKVDSGEPLTPLKPIAIRPLTAVQSTNLSQSTARNLKKIEKQQERRQKQKLRKQLKLRQKPTEECDQVPLMEVVVEKPLTEPLPISTPSLRPVFVPFRSTVLQ